MTQAVIKEQVASTTAPAKLARPARRPAPVQLLVRLARRVLAVLPTPHRTPLTFGYLLVLAATTVVLHAVSDATANRLLLISSTNLDQLHAHPVFVLIASALWLPGLNWWFYLFALTLVMVPLERRIGAGWTLLLVASGHVIMSLVTEGGVAVGIAMHALPAAEGHQQDVGASYVLMTAVGAMIGLLPIAIRLPALALPAYWLGWPLLLDGPNMTGFGHLLCLATGVAWWYWLGRRQMLGTSWPARLPWHRSTRFATRRSAAGQSSVEPGARIVR